MTPYTVPLDLLVALSPFIAIGVIWLMSE